MKTLNTRPLGNTDLLVTEAGFGCYRVDNETDEHYSALKKALQSGINLIDTSANYTDGQSEQLVGRVIEDCEKEGLERKNLVIVTKAGYIQGSNMEHSRQRQSQGIPYPDIVELSEDLHHSIHPQFLEDQLVRSLRRLNQLSVDVFLLHNPEYYLQWAEARGIDKTQAQNTYYERIKQAFQYLEAEVAAGRIRYYGISSNTLPSNPDDYTHTSIQRVLDCAASISKNNHFKVIQLPMNVCETGAITESPSTLELAEKNGIGVLINRPLNALRNNQLIRLADVPVDNDVSTLEVEDLIQELVEIEMDWEAFEIASTELPEDAQETVHNYLSLGTHLQEHWASFQGAEHWKEVMTAFIVPRIEKAIEILTTHCVLTKFQDEWLRNYVEYVRLITQYITAYYKSYALSQVEAIKFKFQSQIPEWATSYKLSHIALRALRTTPGITSILVGMRHPLYVDDVLAELHRPAEKTATKNQWQIAHAILNSEIII